MEASDLSDILNVRAVKMENCDNAFEDPSGSVEISDPLSLMPQYVTESDLGLMQSSSELLHAPLAVFSDAVDEEDTTQSSDSADEVIVQLMDIRTRLSKLKSMLEKRLNTDLTDYTFWLQDAKMLESHKTLVEQCVRGAGVVQVNLQVRAATKKINILDVLKPDDETFGKEEVQEYKCAPEQDTVPATTLSAPSHAAAVRWVVDGTFRADRRAKIPDDPNEWSVQHTRLWIQWAVRQFNAKGVRLADWSISGAQLCALTNQQFKEKVPSDPGDLLWTHFELLRKCKFIAVVQTGQPMNPTAELEKPTLQCAIKKKPKLMHMELNSTPVPLTHTIRTGHNGQTQLWQFLLELLTSAKHYDVIRWHGTEGEFKLLEPEKVARLWGLRKHKPAMNYEKLSRALRYYYDGDMIAKVPGKRFVYKFVCDLCQLIGYSPSELAELVREMHAKGHVEDELDQQ